ncbi:hypothetical protein S245_067701, partial [Arachis hypogaea]
VVAILNFEIIYIYIYIYIYICIVYLNYYLVYLGAIYKILYIMSCSILPMRLVIVCKRFAFGNFVLCNLSFYSFIGLLVLLFLSIYVYMILYEPLNC